MKINHSILFSLLLIATSLNGSKAERKNSKLAQTANSFNITQKKIKVKRNFKISPEDKQTNDIPSDVITHPLEDQMEYIDEQEVKSTSGCFMWLKDISKLIKCCCCCLCCSNTQH